MPIGALAATVGLSALSGYMGAKATKDAANTSAAAQRYVADLQDARYGEIRDDLSQYRSHGLDGIYRLANYGETRVNEDSYIPQTSIPRYQPNNFDVTQDPSYKFRLAEQNRGIDRASASYGNILSGNRLEEIMKRSGDFASTEYGAARNRSIQDYGIARENEAIKYNRGVDAYGRAVGRETDYLNRQLNLANIGQNASVQTGNAGMQTTSAVGNAITAGANARAAGQIGTANAWQGVIGDVAQFAGNGGFNTGGPSFQLNAPKGGTLTSTSGGYGGTGMGVWFE